MNSRPPEFDGMDWGVTDQRLAALARRRARIAYRFELAILCLFAVSAALSAPMFIYNIMLGLLR